MRIGRTVAGVGSIALALAGFALAAEDWAGPSTGDPELDARLKLHYTETETVRLVLLPTTVTDRRGRMVKGLDKADFKVWEDRVPQEIRFFSSETTEPIHIAFMLDVSGSMRRLDKIRHAKEAIRTFVKRLRSDDKYALICFADEQVSWVTEFTSDRKLFLDRLEVQRGYGKTALNDAVAAAPGLVDESIKGRKAIVLVTDGVDNASRLSMWRAVTLARRVNVPIYTIGFLSIPGAALPRGTTPSNLEVLERVAVETGGRLFAVHDPVDLKEAVVFLDAELRHQYVLGYYPTRTTADGIYRRITLEVDRSRLDVRTRKGYYAKR